MGSVIFLRVWALIRVFVEFIAGYEILFSMYNVFLNDYRGKAIEINKSSMNSGSGYGSLALVGLISLTHIAYILITMSHDNNPPNLVYLIGFQAVFFSFLIFIATSISFLPSIFIFIGLAILFIGLIAIKRSSPIANNTEFTKYKDPLLFSDWEVTLKDLKLKKEKYFEMNIFLLFSGAFGISYLFAPFEINGALTVLFESWGFSFKMRPLQCTTLLALMNLSQSFVLFLAVLRNDFHYLWLNAEASLVGIFFAMAAAIYSKGGQMVPSLGIKYAIMYSWYFGQTYIMWPKGKVEEY